MNLAQLQTLLVVVNSELVDVRGSAWLNPTIHEGDTVLNGLTPFRFARGLNKKDLTVVLDDNGTEFSRYVNF